MSREFGKSKIAGVGPVADEDEPAPTWTLNASNRFDNFAMIAILCMAEEAARRGELAMPPARLQAMRVRLREFELYEQKRYG